MHVAQGGEITDFLGTSGYRYVMLRIDTGAESLVYPVRIAETVGPVYHGLHVLL